MKMKLTRPLLFLCLILILGGFLRLYRIEDYMGFLGDEGRDALVVKRMLVDGDITLLGPITSVGLMHLGPIYYYFMVPFLFLSGLNPVGPAVMVALFSLATMILMYVLCRDFWDARAGLIAALLYGISPLVINHAHSSWNPNILPFWALLIIYSLMKTVIDGQHRWLFITGLAFGVAMQLHYVALVFVPITIFFLALKRFQIPARFIGLSILGWLLAISPFLLFEIRHGFINTQTVMQFVIRTGDAKSFGLLMPVAKWWDLTVRLFWRLVILVSAELTIGFILAIFSAVIYLYLVLQDRRRKWTLTALLLWFAVGVGILSFYTGIVYDYYLMFAFPFPFLLIGIIATSFSRTKIGKVGVFAVIATLSIVALKNTPILKSPNRLSHQAKEIADFIITKTQNKPYNFALIAAGNSDHAYRYFLELSGHPPEVIKNQVIDPQRFSVQDQLFVVCEEQVCQPLGHSLWEIAGFGRAEIAEEWQVGLFKVYKLVPFVPEGG